jgi:hypothetical protein
MQCTSPLSPCTLGCTKVHLLGTTPHHLGFLSPPPPTAPHLNSPTPDIVELAMQYTTQCVVSLGVVASVLPWFLVPMVPLMTLFLYIARSALGVC